MAVGAAVASIVIGAGVAAYSAHEQKEQAQDAKKESKRQEAQALAFQADTKDAAARGAEQATLAQTRARQRALAYASGAGMSQNIQTSPMGVTSPPSSPGPKMLLGM